MKPTQQDEEAILEKIQAWSEINSGSSNLAGLERMAAVLEKELRRFDVDVERIDLPGQEEILDNGERTTLRLGQALRAVCRPDAPRGILLNGHFDTVFGREHPFQHCRREGGLLRGPGVADMKGGLAVLFGAVRNLENSPDRHGLGWEILLTPDEEIGSPGSARLLAKTAASGRHHAALVFEPALPGGKLASARMGATNYAIFVRGRSAHAGRDFSRGKNAIAGAAELVGRLHALNDSMPDTIVNVGRIAGGGPLNRVPDLACCRLNVRGKSQAALDQINARIRSEAAAIQEEGFFVEIHRTAARPPKPLTPETGRLLEQLRACAAEDGWRLDWEATGGGSDGNNLAAAGLPTIDNLGVRGGGIHTEEEFLEIDSIGERIRLCSRFLHKMARGEGLDY